MKKATSLLMVMALLMGAFATVSADEHENEDRPEHREEFRMQMQENRDDRNAEIEGNRDMMKQNREDFKSEHEGDRKAAFANVDEDTRAKLKTLGADSKAEFEALKSSLRDSDDKDGVLEEMRALHDQRVADMKELLADNPDALALLEERKELFEKNNKLRRDSAEARKEFRGERGELVVKYKTSFVKKIGSKLDRIPDSKLDKLLTRINTLLEKYETSDKLSDTQRDKIISQLTALKEMIEEKFESDDADEDMLDIEAILEVD